MPLPPLFVPGSPDNEDFAHSTMRGFRMLQEYFGSVFESRESDDRLPAGSQPINQTPWSGDHGKIEKGILAKPNDDVRIAPNQDVWSKTRMEAGLTMVMLGAIQAQESQMEDGARTDDKMTLEANQTPKSVRDKIVIQMTHPTLHPDEITEQLDWDPSVTWIAGASRLTARGVPRGGVYPIMYWCGSERREDQKAFFNHLSEIVEHVEERRSFIVNFIQSGGTLGLTLELPGDCHACDLLHAREFVRMARLGIDFGIEVFPDFGDGVGPARGQVAGFAPGGDQVGRWCKQGASENYEKNDRGEMRYEIRLSLHHPTVPALVVTEQLEWTPVSVEEDCGLDHHWVGVEGRQQYRLFFSHFMDLIAHLEERQDFVSEYLGSGGTAAFTVIVPGSCNIGDVLKAESSMRVGQLGIDLKLEVLPGEVQARSVE